MPQVEEPSTTATAAANSVVAARVSSAFATHPTGDDASSAGPSAGASSRILDLQEQNEPPSPRVALFVAAAIAKEALVSALEDMAVRCRKVVDIKKESLVRCSF